MLTAPDRGIPPSAHASVGRPRCCDFLRKSCWRGWRGADAPCYFIKNGFLPIRIAIIGLNSAVRQFPFSNTIFPLNFLWIVGDMENVCTFVPSLIKVCYNLLQIRHHPNDVFSFFLDSYRGAYSEPPRIVFTSSKQFNQWRRKRIMRRFGLLSRWFTRYLSKSERTHASAMARKRTSVHTIVCIGVLYDS